ncbi:MAG: O-antigen ligase family protein [Sphingopyxis sp.]|nr:O-antigen ligase family protein [Sphingopyxis sp.]
MILRKRDDGVRAPQRKPDWFVASMTLGSICLAFAMVGGSRDDLLSLLLWRPVSMLLLVLAVVLCGRDAWIKGRALILFALAVIGLVGVHLIPLPPAVWTQLPGRELIADIFASAGMSLPWQPLSVAQARTWNALFSLAAPLAFLLMVLCLGIDRQRQLLLLLLGTGILSGAIGLLQALGPNDGPLYFYRITNYGSSVGLFANRNHQSLFLITMFPLLAAYAALFQGRADRFASVQATATIVAAAIVPLVLSTGSRSGLLLLPVALILSWWVYRRPAKSDARVVQGQKSKVIFLAGSAVAVGVIGTAVVLLRTPALERLLTSDAGADLRFQGLPAIFDAMRSFFPLGSGIGTFVETYQIFERDALVTNSYFNHAHNDYVELLLTGGVPALLLLFWCFGLGLAALVTLVRHRVTATREPLRSSHIFGRAGFSVLVLLALASATDYPLRVPSLLVFAVIAAAWCCNAYHISRKSHG